MPFLPVEEQLAIIRRGVEKIVPENELATKLTKSRDTNTPLRIKYGIDPTGIDVHLGHTVPLRKIRQFQELGHQAVIIIGNYTALVGDPSGRDHARSKRLTADEVEANAVDYLNQVGKVIDLSRAEVHRNGDWFGSMSFSDILQLCGNVTIAQLLTRDDFAKRYAAQTPIFLHECLYPVMQAFDSVVIGADIELGGTEQLYSFMLARGLQCWPPACQLAKTWMSAELQEMLSDQSDQVVVARQLSKMSAGKALPQQIGVMSPILVGLDGVRRMGKSLGNYIGISESPFDMMKKFMQVPDAVMRMYFELLTDLPLAEIDGLLAGHPKAAKMRLAQAVIDQYHPRVVASSFQAAGKSTANFVGASIAESSFHAAGTSTANIDGRAISAGEAAAEQWQKEVGEGALPTDIPTVSLSRSKLTDGKAQAARLLVQTGLCPTTSDARRAIAQGGAYFGDSKARMESHDQEITVLTGLLLFVGKKKFCRVEVTE